ncbi:hypothetical protein [Micromonospora okii]|uniref:hypothetical protein n=1 Tax=Micromonospora okii TaxID=1182970 RepID=UPI001E514D65|nr:hypothetical protein [Micromonospora okii]
MRFARGFVGMLLLTIGIPATLAGVALGLAARRADGGFTARLGVVDLQARLPDGWFPVTAWVLGALGGLLLISAALLLRPARPREVVFVVEPDQVPVLAGRLGVASLSGLGLRPAPAPAAPADRQLVAVGASAARPRPALGPAPAHGPAPASARRPAPAGGAAPAHRPATLADLAPVLRAAPPAWPPFAPEPTTQPVRLETRRLRPAAPGGLRARQRS